MGWVGEMKFQTKMHEVDAISVKNITKLASEDFSKLPVWIKKKFEESCLFIGKRCVVVDDVYHCEIAKEHDVLILYTEKRIEVMTNKDFFERYEDVWDKNNNSIV